MARSNPRQGGARNHYRDIGFERGRIGDERLSTAAGLEQLQILGEHVVEALSTEVSIPVLILNQNSSAITQAQKL